MLAVATLILKAAGKFNEGNLKANSGYLYVSIVYNISICLSLYCLAIFWMCVNEDLKPYRYVHFEYNSVVFFSPEPHCILQANAEIFMCQRHSIFLILAGDASVGSCRRRCNQATRALYR